MDVNPTRNLPQHHSPQLHKIPNRLLRRSHLRRKLPLPRHLKARHQLQRLKAIPMLATMAPKAKNIPEHTAVEASLCGRALLSKFLSSYELAFFHALRVCSSTRRPNLYKQLGRSLDRYLAPSRQVKLLLLSVHLNQTERTIMRYDPWKGVPLLASIIATLSIAVGCGGGGGGGGTSSSNEPGDISLWLEKGAVDSGDLCRVRVDIYEPNPSGVILKLRFPTSLRYSRNSALLFPKEDDQRAITPSFEASRDGYRYVVFFLSNDDIRYGDYSTLELNLKAGQPDRDALVAVDLDNNDPNIPDSEEFNVKRPQFAPIEELGLEIRGDTSGPATPTATPTKKAG